VKAVIGGAVFTGTESEPIRDGVVLVSGERIVAVGARSEVKVPPDTELISAEGQCVLPGLIDAHQHLGFIDPRDYIGRPEEHDREHERVHNVYEWLAMAVRNGRHFLENGVTTIRTMGEIEAMDLTYKRYFDSGKLLGPQVVSAGRGIVTTFGSSLGIGWPRPRPRVVNGPDEVRQAVRQNIAQGVDHVKIFVSGGMTQGPHKLLMNEQEIRAAVDECHRVGKRLAAHAIGDRSVRVAAELGVDTIEHATYMLTDETVEAVRKSGAACVLSNLWSCEIYVSGVKKGKREGTYESAIDGTMRLYRAGVRLGLGADCIFAGTPLADEAALLVEFGIPNSEVVRIVTSGNAEVCGVADQVGTLKPARLANLIVVDGNPLTDITCLRRVSLTMKAGQVVKASGTAEERICDL